MQRLSFAAQNEIQEAQQYFGSSLEGLESNTDGIAGSAHTSMQISPTVTH